LGVESASSGADDEIEEVFRRTDHCGSEGSGRRSEDEGTVPATRDLRGDVLQLEGEVRGDDRVGGSSAEGARGGEQQAQAAAGRGGARQSGVEGSSGPKMVSPQAKREAVRLLMTERDFGVTPACGLVSISRSLYRYRSRRPDCAALRARIGEIAAVKRRYGYRRVHVVLRREGWAMNRKLTYRLYREAGLA